MYNVSTLYNLNKRSSITSSTPVPAGHACGVKLLLFLLLLLLKNVNNGYK